MSYAAVVSRHLGVERTLALALQIAREGRVSTDWEVHMRIFSSVLLAALLALSLGLWRMRRSSTVANAPPQEATWESLRQRAWTFRVIW
jgi:hypothetical protein